MPSVVRSVLGIVVTAAALGAQSPAPGFRMLSAHASTDTYLIDLAGEVVHVWPGEHPPGNSVYLEPDGTLLRTETLPGGPNIGGRGGALKRIAFDGTVLWNWQYADDNGWAHHDVALMPNGNVLMIAWDRMSAADAIAAGRNPALLASDDWLPDAIIEVRQTGPNSADIVWEWHLMDHVVQDFDPTKPNFGVIRDHPERVDLNYPPEARVTGEWNHCNAIDYDPDRDLIVLSSPFVGELWIIDHSTTTAEAASHGGGDYNFGGDILYRWGNPEAYGVGTFLDRKLFFHHGTNFIDAGLPGAGNLLVFNNRAGTLSAQDYSSLVELELPRTFWIVPGQRYGPTAPVWEFTAPDPTSFYSAIVSSVQRLPNGNTLALAGQSPHLLEVDPLGTIVWEHFPTEPIVPAEPGIAFRVGYVDRTFWTSTRELSVSAGGSVDFHVVAGPSHAADFYLVLGSASGVAPGVTFNQDVRLALNFDGYMSTTLNSANTFPFSNTLGTLDASGRADGSFTLPGGILPAAAIGLEFHHSFVLFDADSMLPVRAGNPVPLTWVD
ncbi:MAG: aryl-sulfate sulfotransferase [Planctomycetes bacterium]|nr:aryl-sulfate sulfotransferase [Planctomycetota bacterium]